MLELDPHVQVQLKYTQAATSQLNRSLPAGRDDVVGVARPNWAGISG